MDAPKTAHPFDLNSEHAHFNADGKAELIASAKLWSLPEAEMHARFGHLLVSSFQFNSDWPTWEMHPHGDELVCLIDGEADLVLREKSGETIVALKGGDSFLIPQGAWHTARTANACRLLFVTYGKGTQVVPKEHMEPR